MTRAVAVVLVAAAGAALLALFAFGFSRDPNAVASPLVNKPAPAFSLRSFDGRQVSLAALRGHPLVLNFWASWCPPCREEQPSMVAAWRAYGPRGVRFVGIEFKDAAPAAEAFMRQFGAHWPTLNDPGQEVAINYGVAGPPETYFIDGHGIVRYKVVGPLTAVVLNQQILRLLGGPA